VWHKAFQVIFESIQSASNNGIAIKCGDEAVWVLYPGLYCLSMDFEEQYVHIYCLDFILTIISDQMLPLQRVLTAYIHAQLALFLEKTS